MAEIGWIPSDDVIASSNVTRLVDSVGLSTFDHLLQRSIEDPAWFWGTAVAFLGLPFSTPFESVMDDSGGPAWTKWFVDGETNLAAMCIDRWHATEGSRDAIKWYGEDGATRSWTRDDLHEHTEGVAKMLRAQGIRAGDRVAIFLPMMPEAVAAFLAVAKIGAVAVPLFSGFGPDPIRVRLVDSQAAAVLTADGTLRRGHEVLMAQTAIDAAAQVPSVGTFIVVPRLGHTLPAPRRPDQDVLPWPARCQTSTTTVPVRTDHELLLAYTSGTTGVPKGAVHTHGGLPIKVAAEGAFQHDLRPSDSLLWFSDMGWIMGPYQIVAALANGATLCLVEGAPDHPTPDRLWRIAEDAGVTVLGLSPTLVRALMPSGAAAIESRDLSALRILGSTGEPWNAGPWLWYFNVVGGGRCPVINMSGGTEVGGALLSPHPVQIIPPCSLVGPSLGIAVDVYDDEGHSVRGRVGELVGTKPWPGMTKGLFGDSARYEATYWNRWPGVWVQGDWASVDDDGFWYLHGRSDDTIMIAGKRLGPIEAESVLVAHPDVVEAAAVGMPHAVKGEALLVFVVAREGTTPGSELADELRHHVSRELGRSFAPADVVFVETLPKTRSGKVVRRALRAIAAGTDPGDLNSLEDPAALEAIRTILSKDSCTARTSETDDLLEAAAHERDRDAPG
jgi:acetyl-CoA synthetase